MREASKGAAFGIRQGRRPWNPLENFLKKVFKTFKNFWRRKTSVLRRENTKRSQKVLECRSKVLVKPAIAAKEKEQAKQTFQKLLTIFFDFSTSVSKNFSTFQQPFLWMKENKLWKSLGIDGRRFLCRCCISYSQKSCQISSTK